METIVPFVSSDNEETFKNDVVTKILQGPYNRLYIGSLKGGVKELNLTSGKISNLLLTDENGENIFFREFILCSEKKSRLRNACPVRRTTTVISLLRRHH